MRAGACAGSLVPRICRCPQRKREGPGTGVQVRKVPVRAASSAGLPLPLWSELTPPPALPTGAMRKLEGSDPGGPRPRAPCMRWEELGWCEPRCQGQPASGLRLPSILAPAKRAVSFQERPHPPSCLGPTFTAVQCSTATWHGDSTEKSLFSLRLWHRKPTRGVPTGFVEPLGPPWVCLHPLLWRAPRWAGLRARGHQVPRAGLWVALCVHPAVLTAVLWGLAKPGS